MDLLVRHTERHDRKERGEEPIDSARKSEAAAKKKDVNGAPGPGGRKVNLPSMPAGQPSSAAVYAADQSQALQQHLYNALPGSTPNIPHMPAFPTLPNGDLSVNTPSSGSYSTMSPHAMSNHSASPAENAFSVPPSGASAHVPTPPANASTPSVFASSLVIPSDFSPHPSQHPQLPPHSQPQPQFQHPMNPPPIHSHHPPQPPQQNGLSLVDQALAAGHALNVNNMSGAPPAPPVETSPFAFDANQGLATVGPGASHHDFEEPFNFLSTNYGAPFASASDYSWLFAPDQSFDVHFAMSRPASPGAGGSEFLAGFGGMTGMQTPGGRFSFGNMTNGMGGAGGISSQLDKVSQQLEATQHQQQREQNGGHPSSSLDFLGFPPHHHGGGRPVSPVKLEPVLEESPGALMQPSPHAHPQQHLHSQPPPAPVPAPIPEGGDTFDMGVRAATTDLPPLDPSDPTILVDEQTRLRVLEYLGVSRPLFLRFSEYR
jgi:hypothetical protein